MSALQKAYTMLTGSLDTEANLPEYSPSLLTTANVLSPIPKDWPIPDAPYVSVVFDVPQSTPASEDSTNTLLLAPTRLQPIEGAFVNLGDYDFVSTGESTRSLEGGVFANTVTPPLSTPVGPPPANPSPDVTPRFVQSPDLPSLVAPSFLQFVPSPSLTQSFASFPTTPTTHVNPSHFTFINTIPDPSPLEHHTFNQTPFEPSPSSPAYVVPSHVDACPRLPGVAAQPSSYAEPRFSFHDGDLRGEPISGNDQANSAGGLFLIRDDEDEDDGYTCRGDFAGDDLINEDERSGAAPTSSMVSDAQPDGWGSPRLFVSGDAQRSPASSVREDDEEDLDRDAEGDTDDGSFFTESIPDDHNGVRSPSPRVTRRRAQKSQLRLPSSTEVRAARHSAVSGKALKPHVRRSPTPVELSEMSDGEELVILLEEDDIENVDKWAMDTMEEEIVIKVEPSVAVSRVFFTFSYCLVMTNPFRSIHCQLPLGQGPFNIHANSPRYSESKSDIFELYDGTKKCHLYKLVACVRVHPNFIVVRYLTSCITSRRNAIMHLGIAFLMPSLESIPTS